VTAHVDVNVDATATGKLASAVQEVVHEAVEIVHDLHTSAPVQAFSNLVTNGINAANNALFGPSTNSNSGH